MSKREKWRLTSLLLGLCLLLAFAAFIPALVSAQSGIRVTKVGDTSIKVSWNAVPRVSSYRVSYQVEGTFGEQVAGHTSRRTYTISGLRSGERYVIWVDYNGGFYQTFATTSVKIYPTPVPTLMPLQITCPNLPSIVEISGHANETQCQMVDNAGVGQMALIKRGVISAVDLWYFVPAGVEVCLRGDGWLAFLDADYAPRMAMDLEHYHRAGMTCGMIDREGTVALLASPPLAATAEPPAKAPSEQTLPLFEPIPLVDCQIKLVETLFMRAAPGGEIIDIVWMNSEVPAYEINGYWYKVEFEGNIGYISRYHRKVLRGGCG